MDKNYFLIKKLSQYLQDILAMCEEYEELCDKKSEMIEDDETETTDFENLHDLMFEKRKEIMMELDFLNFNSKNWFIKNERT